MFLALLMALAHPMPGRSQEVSPQTIERVKRAVVPVTCGALDDQKQFRVVQMIATGFFISPSGAFLTAAHVSDDLDRYAAAHRCFGAIFVVMAGDPTEETVSTSYFPIQSCQTNHALDVAVCFPTGSPFQDQALRGHIVSLKLESVFHYTDGTPMAFTGYPLAMGRPLTSRGSIAALYPDQVVLDKGTWPGASGSPVYSASGSVLGIILQRGTDIATGLAYAAPSDAIMEFLNRQNVPFDH